MKVLFLCKKFPYPLKDGESIAVSNLCKELKSLGCDSTLLCMNTSKHYVDISSLPAEYDHFSEIHTVDIDNTIKPLHALASIISGESYHIRRFRSSAFEAKLIEVLSKQHFDIIQLETLYLAPYVDTIRKFSNARIVMRAHNVEHEIWERITSNTGSRLKKWYLKYLTHKLKEYELQQFTSYDYLVTLTERDLAQFKTKGYKNGASAAPIGFDSGMYPRIHATAGSQMSLCFIGSLDWVPNMEGLNWFLTQCWPEIHKKWPGISFHIAGRNTPKAIKDLKLPNVVIHGEIEDAAEFISAHSAMIVPLFSGSGMRVKIVEGMYLGKVVITTSLGKEGIEGEHKSDFLIADDVKGFVDAIEFCVTHPEEVVQIGNRAKEKAINQFNSLEAAQQILGIYQALLTYKRKRQNKVFLIPFLLNPCRVRIAFVTSRFPYPVEKGDKLRAFHQIRHLSARHEIHLVSLSHKNIRQEDLDAMAPYCASVRVFRINTWLLPIQVLLGWIEGLPLQISYFLDRTIKRQVQYHIIHIDPDHVICQLIRAAPYVRALPFPKTLDYMDVFSEGMRQLSKRHSLFGIFFRWEAARLAAFERTIYKDFDRHMIISEQEKNRLKLPSKEMIAVIPNGVDDSFVNSMDHHTPHHDLVFVGNLGYGPNKEAVRFLVHELLPALKMKGRDLKILIAGARPAASVKKLHHPPSVTVQGWVPDIRDAYRDGRIFVAPMFSGLGLQNKILEAMSMGIPCVTTSMVNNAIGAISGKQILVGDTIEEMITHIEVLLDQPDLYQAMAQNARSLIAAEYRWQDQVMKMEELIVSKNAYLQK